MTKTKKRQGKKSSSRARNPEEQADQFGWIPLWGWILIFLVPLALSEYMFYVADRKPSMILFAVAWIGFWVTIMHRSGWPIIKRRDKRRNDEQEQ